MALLSKEERDELQKSTGQYIKEKCDQCGGLIYELSYIGKDKKVRCPVCARGQNLVMANIIEETKEMASKAKEKKEKKENGGTTKIWGVILPGTAIADLALFLEDEKKHSLKDTLAAISSKHKADKMGRLKQLQRYGKQKNGWGVTIDTDAGTVQLKMGKGVAAAAAPKAAKKEEKEAAPKAKANGKAAKEKEDPEPAEVEEKEAAPSKQQQTLQKLVRKALKGKDDLTTNKLIDVLKDEHELDPKRITAAIDAEIKAGGITKDKGVLQLVEA